jgi:hypothetical protein
MDLTSETKIDIPKTCHLDIKRKVNVKLKEYIVYSDETLAEYVMVLLFNETTNSNFEEKMREFLHDRSHEFTLWLWEIVFDACKEGNSMK